MGLLTALFGTCGKIRFEAICEDGRKCVGTMRIETIGLTLPEIESRLRDILFVEKGVKIASAKVVGFVRE